MENNDNFLSKENTAKEISGFKITEAIVDFETSKLSISFDAETHPNIIRLKFFRSLTEEKAWVSQKEFTVVSSSGGYNVVVDLLHPDLRQSSNYPILRVQVLGSRNPESSNVEDCEIKFPACVDETNYNNGEVSNTWDPVNVHSKALFWQQEMTNGESIQLNDVLFETGAAIYPINSELENEPILKISYRLVYGQPEDIKDQEAVAGEWSEYKDLIIDRLALILDAALAGLTKSVNEKLPDIIKEKGLDPIRNVVDGEEIIGKINLWFCTAKVSAPYNITDLIGLSTIHIDQMKSDHVSGSFKSFAASISIPMNLKDDLTANVGGSLYAGCGIIHKTVKLKGKANISKLTIKSHASLEGSAMIIGRKIVIDEIKIDDLDIDYRSINIKITSFLGIFGFLSVPLTALLSRVLKKYITGNLETILQDAVNQSISELMPYDIKI
jgi:hypothetical protein